MDPNYKTPYTRKGELFNGLVIAGLVLLGVRGRRRFGRASAPVT